MDGSVDVPGLYRPVQTDGKLEVGLSDSRTKPSQRERRHCFHGSDEYERAEATKFLVRVSCAAGSAVAEAEIPSEANRATDDEPAKQKTTKRIVQDL